MHEADNKRADDRQADEKLERLITEVTAALPLRRAPDALRRRVLDELALRAALPWWRRNFSQWPMAARTGFVLVCAVLAGLSLTSGVTQRIGGEASAWAQPIIGGVTAIGAVMTRAVSLVPPLYLYLALIVGGLLYALLFGIGAIAYRTLYLQPANTAMVRS
jgi:hypothetical protein